MKRRIALLLGGAAALAALAWGVDTGLDRLATARRPAAAPVTPPPPAPTAHITATLFYSSPDGLSLVSVRREVPLAEGTVAQGHQILRTQLQPAPAPLVSVIPPGTALRAFYVTARGDAFVDLSSDLSRAHPGGSHTELLTVYAIVNAVTANLPGVQRVQLLIDGKEADSVAGHIDIRRPLERDQSMVRAEAQTALQ